MADYILDGNDLSEEQLDSLQSLISSVNVLVDSSEDVNISIRVKRGENESAYDGSWLSVFAEQNAPPKGATTEPPPSEPVV